MDSAVNDEATSAKYPKAPFAVHLVSEPDPNLSQIEHTTQTHMNHYHTTTLKTIPKGIFSQSSQDARS
jgi:hypothetical protein